MRVYEVQPGDSPASIAAQDSMAGCPKCAIDLIRANPHKPTRKLPNGYVTFRELRAGEKLNIPDKWHDGTLDRLPPSYFAALPYADGVTPGKSSFGVGAAPYSADLVAAAEAVDATLSNDNDALNVDYCVTVTRPGSATNSAVHAFKLLWNATQTPPVPINTGNYELQTADAVKATLGGRLVWDPCPPRTATPRASKPPITAPQPSAQKQGLSTGAVAGIALLGASALSGAIYLATQRRRR